MTEAAIPERTERIVVALDASPQSMAALKAAVELAAVMEAEVEGLFVEDIDLLHLCDFPFCYEIGSYTATLRRTDNRGMERQLRVVATTIRQTMERVAAQTPVRWSFRVRRGSVVQELLDATQDAALLSLGRAGRVHRKGIGSTAQSLVSQTQRPLLIAGEDAGLHYPLTVVYTGSAAARRALDLAARLSRAEPARLSRAEPARLSRAEPARLRVVVWDAGGAPSGTAKLEQEVRRLAAIRSEAGEPGVIILPVTHSTDDLLAALAALDGGTLVLPHEQADLISQHSGPTLLVP